MAGNKRVKGDGKGRQGGRKKGTPNKATVTSRAIMAEFIRGNITEMQKHLDALSKAEEHDKWLNYFLRACKFDIPEMAAVTMSVDTTQSDLASEIEGMAEMED